MSTDLFDEPLITLKQAAALPWLPTRAGRPIRYKAVLRWATIGLKGIHLESQCVGGTRCTSDGAMRRFFSRLAMPHATTDTVTPKQRKKQIERAEAICKAAGI